MTKSDPRAEEVIKRYDQLKNARLPYESQWNDVQKLVRLNTTAFYSNTEGDRRNDAIFDGTAIEANEKLGSGLMAYLTSSTDRWFELQTERMHHLRNDPASLRWLEEVSEIIYHVYSNEGTAFNSSLHEAYLDLGAFGTAVVNQEENYHSGVLFRTFPLADCWIAENHEGRVDTLFRRIKYNGRQAVQEFGDNVPAEIRKPENQAKEFSFLHAVYPRTDRTPMSLNSTNKAFASIWVCEELKCTVAEGGYDSFPYHVPRWTKLSNERYGRSPAMKCLPDIRMLNRMEFTILKAGQKQVDPPLVIPNDGFLLPIKTHPGALIFRDDGGASNNSEIQTLEHKGNLPWAEEKCTQKRNAIREAFHMDWIMRARKNPNVEQSATEITDDRDESLRMMGPMLGRLQAELLGPLLQRTYEILDRKRYLPAPPRGLQGHKLKLVYTSPATRAQVAVRAVGIGRLFSDLAPVAQLQPDVFDAINMDAAAQELAIARGTSRRVIRSPEEIAAIRADRAQQQQAQQLAGMMEPASKAALNMAKAKEAGGGIGV